MERAKQLQEEQGNLPTVPPHTNKAELSSADLEYIAWRMGAVEGEPCWIHEKAV